jgi:hypothetical protein
MKNLFLPFLLAILIVGCETEPTHFDEQDLTTTIEDHNRGINSKVDVCHNGNIITININAIPAHQDHGDAVDMDGDGYFDAENSCSSGTDCDDNDQEVYPGATETLCNGIDDDCNAQTPDQLAEICDNGIDDDCDGDIDEADSDCVSGSGTFVPSAGLYAIQITGLYTWYEAKAECNNLVTPDGANNWRLANNVNELYDVATFNSPQILTQSGEYWTNSVEPPFGARTLDQYGSYSVQRDQNLQFLCVCVRN